jgi:hypothetical protein
MAGEPLVAQVGSVLADKEVAAVCRSAWAEMTGNPRALAGVLLLKLDKPLTPS